MNHDRTLYDALEVSPRASAHVIKAAYRCLAQHHHPDKNPGSDSAGARLALINHAYAILSEPGSRQAYDRSLGLHCGFVERRVCDVAAGGSLGRATPGHKVSRPFGFRPLA